MDHQQSVLEDDPKGADMRALRQELEKSIPQGDNIAAAAGNISPDGNAGGSVVSEIDREPAVVVQMAGIDRIDPVLAGGQRKASDDEEQILGEEQQQTDPPKNEHGGGNALKGKKLAKNFGRKVYIGEVTSYDSERTWYKVEYEDGDQEELWWWELEPLLHQYEKKLEMSSTKKLRPASDKKLQDPDEEHFELLEELCDVSSTPETSGDDDWDATEASPRPRRSGRKRISEQAERGSVSTESKQDSEEKPADSNRRRRRPRASSVDTELLVNSNGQLEDPRPGSVEDSKLTEVKTPIRENQNPDNVPRIFSNITYPHAAHQALDAARFLKNGDKDLEFFAWGEIASFDRSKCPVLTAVEKLPTLSPIVHLSASQHHLAVLTAAGQVFIWRNKHGNITNHCNEWEHVPDLDDKSIVLVDIGGPDLERSSAGYSSNQENQVPDPFFLAAVSYSGKEYILQGSQPQEPVHTYALLADFHYPSLEDLLRLNDTLVDNVGGIVQVSVGTIDAVDEPPFIGYITDTDRVYIRSATNDFIEEVNQITGFSGKPMKIQCGSAYHAIIMTDDGHAWTWGRGYIPGSGKMPSVCEPSQGSLVNKKVVDVSCCGEDFVALTDDGETHQWTHGPTLGIQHAPMQSSSLVISSEDKLEKIALGVGVAAGITSNGKLHTWRTSLGHPVAGRSATPLGRDDGSKETCIASLGATTVLKVFCIPGSALAVGRKKPRQKPGAS